MKSPHLPHTLQHWLPIFNPVVKLNSRILSSSLHPTSPRTIPHHLVSSGCCQQENRHHQFSPIIAANQQAYNQIHGPIPMWPTRQLQLGGVHDMPHGFDARCPSVCVAERKRSLGASWGNIYCGRQLLLRLCRSGLALHCHHSPCCSFMACYVALAFPALSSRVSSASLSLFVLSVI